MRSETILARTARAGVTSAAVTAKDKLRSCFTQMSASISGAAKR